MLKNNNISLDIFKVETIPYFCNRSPNRVADAETERTIDFRSSPAEKTRDIGCKYLNMLSSTFLQLKYLILSTNYVVLLFLFYF